MMTKYPVLIILLLGLLASCAKTGKQELTFHRVDLGSESIEKIKQVRIAYGEAWLAGDSTKILSLFTEDATLIPHHGDPPVQGIQNIKDFWFPANSPATKVTVYSSQIDEVGGSNEIAFIRGRQKIVFEYDGDQFRNEGNFVGVMKNVSGEWKFHILTWNDPPFEL